MTRTQYRVAPVTRRRLHAPQHLVTRFLLLVVVLGYAWLLQQSYLLVEGIRGYTAVNIRDLDEAYLLASVAILGGMTLLMPVMISRPSQAALWLLFLMWYVPSMLFTYHVGELEAQETLVFLLFVTLAFAGLIAGCRFKPIRLPRLEVQHTTFVLILGIATVIIAAFVLVLVPQTSAGSAASLFDLDEVYTRRLQARQLVAGRSITGYAFATLSYSLAPMLFVYGVVSRRRLLAVVGAASLLSVFLLDGTKGNLFAPMLLVLLVVLAQRPRVPFGLACTLGLTALVGLSMVSYLKFDNPWLSTNIIRRVIVIRGTTLGAYFELFRDRPMFMQDSSLMAIVGDRALDKAYQIGEVYGSGLEANWNGSAWAAMFADFGIPGLFIASLATSVILRCYDGTLTRAPFAIVAVMAGYVGHTWGDGAVTSSILTYGVLCTLLLLSHYGAPAVAPEGTTVASTAPGRGLFRSRRNRPRLASLRSPS